MTIAPDKIRHLAWGAAAALALLGLLLLAQRAGIPAALALAGPAVGWGLERYQAVRREGVADWRDAVATAVPFEVAAIAAALVPRFI